MISSTFGVDAQTLGIVIIGLFMFGNFYAVFVYWLSERKAGYVSLFVVLGVGVTLAAEAILDSRAAYLSLILFIASGLPMIVGEVVQHMLARERAIREGQKRAQDAIREMGRDE